jgi:hypothetical protein
MSRRATLRRLTQLTANVERLPESTPFPASQQTRALEILSHFTTLLYSRVPYGAVTWVGTLPNVHDGTLATISTYLEWMLGHLITTAHLQLHIRPGDWVALDHYVYDLWTVIATAVSDTEHTE